MLVERRPDQPLALATAEAAHQAGDGPLRELAGRLGDEGWVGALALGLASEPEVGVLSMGDDTRRLLGAVIALRDRLTVVTRRASVAHGLGDLGVDIRMGEPTGAPVWIVPVAASAHDRVWTTTECARALVPEGRWVLALDPLCRLTPWGRRRFRPPPWLTARPLATGRASR